MDVTDDIVDGLQAMLRGDAPPCACDIVVGGAGLEGDSGGGNPNTSAVPGVDGPSMEEVRDDGYDGHVVERYIMMRDTWLKSEIKRTVLPLLVLRAIT